MANDLSLRQHAPPQAQHSAHAARGGAQIRLKSARKRMPGSNSPCPVANTSDSADTGPLRRRCETPIMERSFFSTNAGSDPAAPSAWTNSLAQFCVAATPSRSDPLAGEMVTRELASGLQFTVMRSTPQTIVSETPVPSNHHWISLLLEGSGHYDGAGGARVFQQGDFFFGRRGADAELALDTPFRMLLVNIPNALLARRIHLSLPRDVMHISGRSTNGRLVSNMLSAVADIIDDVAEDQILPVELALPQFLMSAVFGEGGAPAIGGATAMRAALLHRVCLHIDQQLDDPDLNVNAVAAASNLSVRYLQKLFEERGDAFAAYVKRRRLEHCRADLADPRNATVSITSICFRWGFNDAASFSRAFSAEFGLSPRAFRQRAAGAKRKLQTS